jgi:diguanylate cyclase (GGDEF)-like protein/PAS domain S-box-containing protein
MSALPAPPPGWLDALPHATWLVDTASQRVTAVNAAAVRLLGVPAAALVGRRAEQLAASPEDMLFWAAAQAGEADALLSDTALVLRPDDDDARVLFACRSARALPGGAVLVTVQDRSADRRLEDEREARIAELEATLESSADGLLVTDLDGRIRSFNRRFAELWRLDGAALAGGDDATVHAALCAAVADTEAYQRRLDALREAALLPANDRIELADGRVFDRVTRPLWRSGRPMGRVWSYRDLSERVAAERRAEELEHTDALTGLPNRQRFAAHVQAELAALRSHGGSFAVLQIDLDHFRQVNHSLGHAVGDRALLDTAQRITGCLREHDVLARIGGDQFALLLAGADAGAAEQAARRVLHAVAQPSSFDGAHFTLTCSIGIALAPAHGREPDDLMRHAEGAMRAVKQGGRANARLHQARSGGANSDKRDRRSALRLDHAMRQALVSGRFRLHYQPQVGLADGRVIGAEALLRWRDPELGEISPAQFIRVAEQSGFIVPIGDWVLSQAVRQAALWHQRGMSMPIAVNVSALQFQQGHFVDRVASVLAVSGVPPQLLELELTESILVHDADEALTRLHALARLGVRLSIDDFGTGYSSLAYLKRFPIDKLKIDRSFVAGLPGDDSDAGIVSAILHMARALGMRVVAEGVETEAQREFLAQQGCHEFQGWLYAPALDALSFEQRFAGSAPPPRARAAPPRMRLVR